MTRSTTAPRARPGTLAVRTLVVLAGWSVGPVGRAAPGDIDPTFGVGGLVTTDFGGAFDEVRGLAIGSGKIAAVGTGGPSNRFAIAVYDMNGSLDTGFSDDGTLIIDQTAGSAAVAWLPDGDLLVAPRWLGGSFGFMVGRLNPDGSYDTGFGVGGCTTVPMGTQPKVGALRVHPDGKITVGGYSYFSGNWQWAFARFHPNGTLDATFAGGTVTTDFGNTSRDKCYDIVIQADGKLVAGGESEDTSGLDGPTLVRYKTDGTLDTSFGVDGVVVVPSAQVGTYASIYGLALQADGRIVACGGAAGDSLVMRFNPNGDLDPTFGLNGVLCVAMAASNDTLEDIALDGYGRILAVGSARVNNQWRQAMVRVVPNGGLDSTFGDGGIVVSDFGTPWEWGHAVAVPAQGTLLMGGSTGQANVDYNFALSRYSNGMGSGVQEVEIVATVDGEAASSAGGPFAMLEGEYVVDVNRSTALQTDSRGILEFDVNGIPDNANVLSADLMLDIASLTSTAGTYPFLVLYGYPGNGVLEPADATLTADEVGVTMAITTLGPLTVSLTDLGYVESVVQGTASHLGLVLYAGRANYAAGFWTLEAADLVDVDAAKLVLQYEAVAFAPGDFDLDGDVDLDDYRSLVWCMNGPDVVPPPECGVKDLDGNHRVDLADFAAFQAAFGG